MSAAAPEAQPEVLEDSLQDAPDSPESDEQEAPDQSEGTEAPEPTEGDEEVPATVLRKKLEDANAEAANYRVKLREAQAALKDAKTAEEFEAARTEFENKINELELDRDRRDVAEEAGIPAALRHLIVGSNREEMKAQAEVLKPFLREEGKREKLPSTPPRGGLDPTNDDDGELDPAVLRREVRRRRR